MTASNSLLVGALLFAFPMTALADAAPAAVPTEEQVQAARVPYREARELHRQGKLKEALEHALEAYRIAATPVTALEAGHLLVEAGRFVEARDVVRSVALFPVSPRESDKGREARQEAATLGSSLDARIPKVAFAGRPAGVDVVLDGKPFAATDPTAWLGLDPGGHAIVVRAGDHTCTTINVTLTEGEARTIDLHEVASTCRADAAPAPLPAESQPLPSPAPAGPATSVTPRDATRAPMTPPPPPPTSAARPWRWVGVTVAGIGAIAAVSGGVVALAAKGNYDSVGNECGPNGCSLHGYDVRLDARSQADAGTVALVVGAAAIAGGALLIVFAPTSQSRDALRPAVAFGPGSVRLALGFP